MSRHTVSVPLDKLTIDVMDGEWHGKVWSSRALYLFVKAMEAAKPGDDLNEVMYRLSQTETVQ